MKYKIYQFYLAVVLLATLGLLSLTAAINFYIDPANHFYQSHAVENEIANRLLADKQVILGQNYNERAVQKIVINKLNNNPELLVLGSSHSLSINQKLFPELTLYNASVPAGTLEDDIALYYLFQKSHGQPKVVLLCIDPWILDSEFQKIWMPKQWQEQWKSTFSVEYNAALKLFNFSKKSEWLSDTIYPIEKYKQLISMAYLSASIKQLRTKNLPIQNELCPQCEIRHADGSRTPSLVEEAITGDQAKLGALDQIQYLRESFRIGKDIAHLATNNLILENFIQYLIKQKIKVVFYLPPVEPAGFSILEQEALTTNVEKYAIFLAKKYDLQVIGSYNPMKNNLQEKDFIDGWHLKRDALEKIFFKKRLEQ